MPQCCHHVLCHVTRGEHRGHKPSAHPACPQGICSGGIFPAFPEKKISLQGITGMLQQGNGELHCDPRGTARSSQHPQALLGLTLELQELPVPCCSAAGEEFPGKTSLCCPRAPSGPAPFGLTWRVSGACRDPEPRLCHPASIQRAFPAEIWVHCSLQDRWFPERLWQL